MIKYNIDPVWYVRESFNATFPYWIPEEKRIVIVAQLYSAYLDDSGTHHGSDIVAVAGFVSNVPKWVEFTKEWDSLLKVWQIPYFHMSEFESYEGCYKAWTTEQHKERLNKLLEIIKKYTFQSISYVIRKKQFDEILSQQAKRICGDAYGLASIGCWYNLRQIAKQPQNSGYIDYTMESGTKGRSALAWIHGEQSKYPDWVEDTRIHSLSFRNKWEVPPLQAADILAYEMYKSALAQFMGDKHRERYPLRQLKIPSRFSWHYADDAELKKTNDYLVDLFDKSVSGE